MLQDLLKNVELGNKTPSQLLNHMKGLLGAMTYLRILKCLLLRKATKPMATDILIKWYK